MGPSATAARIGVALSARVRPTSDRRDQLLPLVPPLAVLTPDGGLRRGTVVTVEEATASGEATSGGAASGGAVSGGGATTLTFGLLAAATTGGSWCAAVGVADLGVLAVAELGVDLDRLLLVPVPGPRWAEVTAALVESLDAVVVRPPGRARPGVARRLAAKARERRCALVVLAQRAPWPEGPDLRLVVHPGSWHGVGAGHGHLRGRRVEVSAVGRRAAVRETRTALWLPDPSGTLAVG